MCCIVFINSPSSFFTTTVTSLGSPVVTPVGSKDGSILRTKFLLLTDVLSTTSNGMLVSPTRIVMMYGTDSSSPVTCY